MPAGDPLDRPIPARFPEFRELVTGEEYTERFESQRTDLEQARQRAAAKTPVGGIRVEQVLAGSPAQKLGLRPGDIVTRLDDQVLWSRKGLPRTGRPQKLEFFAVATGKLKTGTIEPGPIGFHSGADVWQPEIAYLREASKNRQWDAEAYVGIVSAQSDPDLAETAWHHAVKKGYVPDAHAAVSGIRFATAQGRPEIASDFAHFAQQGDIERGDLVSPLLLFRTAAANYQLREMLRLVGTHPHLFSIPQGHIQQLIEMHTQRPAAEREQASPHELAAKLVKDNLLPWMMGSRVQTVEQFLPALQQKDTVTMQASPAHFQTFAAMLPEPTPNFEISLRFTWQAEPGDDGGYVKQLQVELQDCLRDLGVRPDEFGRQPALMACSIEENGTSIELAEGDSVDQEDPRIRQEPDAIHHLQFLRVQGRGEVFLDGQRLLYVPVLQPANPVGLYLKVVGSKLVILDLTVKELIENEINAE